MFLLIIHFLERKVLINDIKEVSGNRYPHIPQKKLQSATMKLISILFIFVLIQKSISFDEIDSGLFDDWSDFRRHCHGGLHLYNNAENHRLYRYVF